jgi:hypothetical protein
MPRWEYPLCHEPDARTTPGRRPNTAQLFLFAVCAHRDNSAVLVECRVATRAHLPEHPLELLEARGLGKVPLEPRLGCSLQVLG